MVIAHGAKNITIWKESMERLNHFYIDAKKGRPKLKLFTFVNEYLASKLEDNDYLSRYGPFISWIGPEGDRFILRDYNLDCLIEVQIKDSNLYCLYHEVEECVHIGFCYAIPDVYKRLMEIGFKPLQALVKMSDRKERQRSINE